MAKFDKTKPHAFIDGSYNEKTNYYGWGGILLENNNIHFIQGKGNKKTEKTMRNVAGEINAALSAVELAIELRLDSITLLYDYNGISAWANLEWARNNKVTESYANKMQDYMNLIDINFVKVEAHTGVEGNEIADRLAKQAVDIKI